jgi:hypothetical protein
MTSNIISAIILELAGRVTTSFVPTITNVGLFIFDSLQIWNRYHTERPSCVTLSVTSNLTKEKGGLGDNLMFIDTEIRIQAGKNPSNCRE